MEFLRVKGESNQRENLIEYNNFTKNQILPSKSKKIKFKLSNKTIQSEDKILTNTLEIKSKNLGNKDIQLNNKGLQNIPKTEVRILNNKNIKPKNKLLYKALTAEVKALNNKNSQSSIQPANTEATAGAVTDKVVSKIISKKSSQKNRNKGNLQNHQQEPCHVLPGSSYTRPVQSPLPFDGTKFLQTQVHSNSVLQLLLNDIVSLNSEKDEVDEDAINQEIAKLRSKNKLPSLNAEVTTNLDDSDYSDGSEDESYSYYDSKNSEIYGKDSGYDNESQYSGRYLASGDSMISMSYAFRISASAVSNIIYETCNAIWDCLSETELFKPSEESWLEIAKDFEEKWQLPHCVGALDGKHVVIQAPTHSGSTFYNYKGTHSIVLLALCDASYKFTLVDIGAEGRHSDGGILKNSNIGKLILDNQMKFPAPATLTEEGEPINYYIAADEAFPLTTCIMRPYPGRFLSPIKRIFNYSFDDDNKSEIQNNLGNETEKSIVVAEPEYIDLDNYFVKNRKVPAARGSIVNNEATSKNVQFGNYLVKNSTILTCLICKKTFKSKKGYMHHTKNGTECLEQKCHQKRMFFCIGSCKFYGTEDEFLQHKLQKHFEKFVRPKKDKSPIPVVCEKCTQPFYDAAVLKRHQTFCGKQEMACLFCDFVCEHLTEYNLHISSQHSKRAKRDSCSSDSDTLQIVEIDDDD